MIDNKNYFKNKNREQRSIIDQQEEIIKPLKKENYKAKQSIYEKLLKIRNIGKSNDICKNIKMLDIVEELIDDIYFDIKEEHF